MAADKTSKQLTDTINRGGYSTMAEAGGEGRSTVWGYCHPSTPGCPRPKSLRLLLVPVERWKKAACLSTRSMSGQESLGRNLIA